MKYYKLGSLRSAFGTYAFASINELGRVQLALQVGIFSWREGGKAEIHAMAFGTVTVCTLCKQRRQGPSRSLQLISCLHRVVPRILNLLTGGDGDAAASHG
jgi:hypothetical protein